MKTGAAGVGPEIEAIRLKQRVTFSLPAVSMEKQSKMKKFWMRWISRRKVEKKSGGQRKFSAKKFGKALRKKATPKKTMKLRPMTSPSASVKPSVASFDTDDDDVMIHDELLIEGESEVLTRRELQKLSLSFPSRLLCSIWRKTYNSSEHGFSLNTFYGLSKVY
jgi:hypothetical protein